MGGARLRRGWLTAMLALTVVGLTIDAPAVLAHAVLLRSIPAGRQTLAEPPTQVRLLFSEPIDPVFSSMRVYDATRQPVDRGDARVDPQDDRQLVVSLSAGLPNGVYTVSWRSLSTIDIHPDEGQFALFVGVPVTAEPAVNSGVATTATPATTLGRWWFYVAASLFGGVLAMWKLVLGGVIAEAPVEVAAVMRRRARWLIVLGGALLLLGTLFTAVAQAAAAADVSLPAAIGRPITDLLLRGRYAAIWWPRLGLEVASLALIALGGLEGLAADCALATLPAVLLTSSLTSHGAALGSGASVGILVDWLHIVGATAWVGGLIGVLAMVPIVARSGLVARLLERFARFALVAAGVVVLSGTLQAVSELGAWSELVGSAYGQLVVAKAALLIAMLGLAVFNEWRGRQAVAGASGGVLGLRRGVQVELVLGVVVLAVAAVLSGTPPSRVG